MSEPLTPDREAELRENQKKVAYPSLSIEELLDEITRLRLELEGHQKAMDLLNKGFESACADRDRLKQENRDLTITLIVRDEELRLLREACAKEDADALQTLGKALGYPWFKDDQANFPGATEAAGVIICEHTPATLAAEAAQRIASDAEELRRLREAAEPFARVLPVCAGHHDRWPLTDAWDESVALTELDCGHVRKLAALLPVKETT